MTSNAQGPIITAPGSFQSELGCPGDWAPDCMRSWLQDPDGDGTYTFSTDQIPAGNYEFKVAVGLGWAESYPANNVAFSVPSDGVLTTITYKASTHEVTVKTSKAGAAPDLTKAKAFVVGPDLVAWPASALPAGTDPATLRWRLHWSADGGLARRRRGRHRWLRRDADPRPRRPAGLARGSSTRSSRAPSPCASTRRRRSSCPRSSRARSPSRCTTRPASCSTPRAPRPPSPSTACMPPRPRRAPTASASPVARSASACGRRPPSR